MELTLWFKGENGKLQPARTYFFEKEALDKLRKDFDNYCQNSNSNLDKGGWYECKHNDKETIVFLKFQEILYIG